MHKVIAQKKRQPGEVAVHALSLGLRSRVAPQRCPLSSSVAKIVIKPDKPLFDLSVFFVSFSGYIVRFVVFFVPFIIYFDKHPEYSCNNADGPRYIRPCRCRRQRSHRPLSSLYTP